MEKSTKSQSQEYVLLAGVSSVFVLLHKGRSFTKIHCFDNIHIGPISDLLFETFSIISVSSTDAKVVIIKANENLIKAEACIKAMAVKSSEKRLQSLLSKAVEQKKNHYRDIGLDFSKFKVKRVLLSSQESAKNTPKYISLSVDTSVLHVVVSIEA